MGDKPQRADLHEGARQRSVRPGETRQVEGRAEGGDQGHQRGRHVGGGLHRGSQGHDVRRGRGQEDRKLRQLPAGENVCVFVSQEAVPPKAGAAVWRVPTAAPPADCG